MFPPRPTTLAHTILRPMIQPGDVVIDATAGNGHDTLFLAECVCPAGKVLAFDVQEKALQVARERVAEFSGRVEFHLESHVEMSRRAVHGTVAVVMFNLGYLPGEDHALTTETGETLRALEAAATVLRPGGILSIVCYPGHAGGGTEAEAAEHWMATQAETGWRVARYGAIGTRRPAPFLLLGTKPRVG